jgi:hypothetical protein
MTPGVYTSAAWATVATSADELTMPKSIRERFFVFIGDGFFPKTTPQTFNGSCTRNSDRRMASTHVDAPPA